MGLKARKIKTMMEEHATNCADQLNKKLNTSFKFEFDWTALPENVDGWNWDDDALMGCFYNSFFYPLENTFTKLFADKMYRDAITQQIKTIKIESGRSMVDYDIEGACLHVKHTLSPNQRELKNNGSFNKSAESGLTEVIDSKLS